MASSDCVSGRPALVVPPRPWPPAPGRPEPPAEGRADAAPGRPEGGGAIATRALAAVAGGVALGAGALAACGGAVGACDGAVAACGEALGACGAGAGLGAVATGAEGGAGSAGAGVVAAAAGGGGATTGGAAVWLGAGAATGSGAGAAGAGGGASAGAGAGAAAGAAGAGPRVRAAGTPIPGRTGLGATTRFFTTSTCTVLDRPWLKDWRTLPASTVLPSSRRPPGRRLSLLLPASCSFWSLIRRFEPDLCYALSRRDIRTALNQLATSGGQKPESLPASDRMASAKRPGATAT